MTEEIEEPEEKSEKPEGEQGQEPDKAEEKPAKPRRRAIPENDHRLMSVDDLAEYLGIPFQSVYKQRSMGTGPPGYRL
jgi:hypothetical protein